MKKVYQAPLMESKLTFMASDVITFSQTYDFGEMEEKDWNKLKITVAGVPKKKGVLCLKDNINNFHKNFAFFCLQD